MYLPSGVLISSSSDALNHIELCKSCLEGEQCSKAIAYFNVEISACKQYIDEEVDEWLQLVSLQHQELFS